MNPDLRKVSDESFKVLNFQACSSSIESSSNFFASSTGIMERGEFLPNRADSSIVDRIGSDVQSDLYSKRLSLVKNNVDNLKQTASDESQFIELKEQISSCASIHSLHEDENIK